MSARGKRLARVRIQAHRRAQKAQRRTRRTLVRPAVAGTAAVLALSLAGLAPALGAATRHGGVPAATSTPSAAPPSTNPQRLASVGGRLYFSGFDAVHGRELWTSDGTRDGTALLADLDPGSDSSSPGYFTDVGGTVFFTATSAAGRTDLWKTDGTAAGTVLVKDVQPAASSAPRELTAVGDTLFFTAAGGSGRQLWTSDGTDAGTVALVDLRPASTYGNGLYYLTALDGALLFADRDADHGSELWTSDGTTAGTALLKDDFPGTASAYASELTPFAGEVFFHAQKADGWGLWKTDGTEAGTVEVKHLNGPGVYDYGYRVDPAVSGGTLYFELGSAAGEAQLWASDGTESGTVEVGSFDHSSTAYGTDLEDLTGLNGAVYFTVAGGGYYHYGLYRAESFAGSAAQISDANPYYGGFTAAGGTLFFDSTDTDHGFELWKSGVGVGTGVAVDIVPGRGSSTPAAITAVGDEVYFSARGPTGTRELWKSDGSASGTVPLTGPPPDVTPPDTSITSGPADGATITSSSATFGFTGTPGDTATLQCSLDGGAYADCRSPHVFTGLADGSHTVGFRAVDAAGNVDATPATRTFTVDTTAPTTSITSGPAPGARISTSSATFGFAGTAGDTATLQCQLDGSAFTVCTSPHTFTGLVDGRHTVGFRAVDAAGNADPTPVTRTFTVSTAATPPPPTPPAPPPPPAPVNTFSAPSAGKANHRKATLVLTVALPGSGTLSLAPAGRSPVRSTQVAVAAAGQVKITVKLTRAGLERIEQKASHRLKVKVALTFTPTGGTAHTETKRYTIILR